MRERRMFLAMWPDEYQIEQLHILQSAYAGMGREVAPENFHITLLFLGNVSYQTIDCLRDSISNLRLNPFAMRLDRLGYFDKTKIFWLGPSQVPSELEYLFKTVRQQAQRCGITQLNKKYVPHVTLLRKCDGLYSDPDFTPIDWQIDEFHLVESRMERDSAHYYTLDSFPLMNHL